MKKLLFFFMTSMMVLLFSSVVYGATSIDKTNTAKGYISVDYQETTFPGVVQIINTETKAKYQYMLYRKGVQNFPLNAGDGPYQFVVGRMQGTTAISVLKETADVKITSPNDMYLLSMPLIDYNKDLSFIKDIIKLIENDKSDTNDKKLKTVYNFNVNNITYDYDKAENVKSNYQPVIDDVYSAKKGICYDYAALLAAALRQQNIPTRLVMGYCTPVGEKVYHAWNEILINGKWIIIDSTHDAAYVQAKKTVTAEKTDKEYFQRVKVY